MEHVKPLRGSQSCMYRVGVLFTGHSSPDTRDVLHAMAALRRVSVMAEERNKPVKLLLGPGALVLSAASHYLDEAEEALAIDSAIPRARARISALGGRARVG